MSVPSRTTVTKSDGRSGERDVDLRLPTVIDIIFSLDFCFYANLFIFICLFLTDLCTFFTHFISTLIFLYIQNLCSNIFYYHYNYTFSIILVIFDYFTTHFLFFYHHFCYVMTKLYYFEPIVYWSLRLLEKPYHMSKAVCRGRVSRFNPLSEINFVDIILFV